MYSHSLRRAPLSQSQGGSAASSSVSGQAGLGQAGLSQAGLSQTGLGQVRTIQNRSQSNSIARNPADRRIEKRKQRDLPRNVMEQLVAEEIDRQLSNLSANQLRYLKPTQISAYALNRLPSLYITSDRGWQRQMRRLESDGLREKIQIAVRQGIIAVQRDPLREVDVLADPASEEAAIALQELRQLLNQPDLGWHNIASTVRTVLHNAPATAATAGTSMEKLDPELEPGWHSQDHYL